MSNKTIIPALLLTGILIFSFVVFAPKKNKTQNQPETNKSTTQENQQSQQNQESQIILFYGQGCPHCAKVEEYINENKVKEKISFEEKEVYYNQNNAKELGEKAKSCGLDQNEIGVPFLWNNGKCIIGDQDIIDFFKEKTKAT
jgi:glutaredoxin